jgi:hypothetical protein
MSNIVDENLNEMEQDLVDPAETIELPTQAVTVLSEDGGEDAPDEGSSSGSTGGVSDG